ncbi:MAG TPA: hypothetical protein VMP11_05335 [Verrucomicrobiae bacterium]|nr:hypothetical protein [Verrucomicrobiae bacterium]
MKEAGGLYKAVVDGVSGRYAEVDTNREVVTLRDTTGQAVWSSNIAKRLETNSNSRVSGRKITGLRMYKGDLWVELGRGYAVIDVKTGELKGTASN